MAVDIGVKDLKTIPHPHDGGARVLDGRGCDYSDDGVLSETIDKDGGSAVDPGEDATSHGENLVQVLQADAQSGRVEKLDAFQGCAHAQDGALEAEAGRQCIFRCDLFVLLLGTECGQDRAEDRDADMQIAEPQQEILSVVVGGSGSMPRLLTQVCGQMLGPRVELVVDLEQTTCCLSTLWPKEFPIASVLVELLGRRRPPGRA